MAARPLSPREHFRQAGRDVLLVPGDRKLHEVRVMAACALDGAEPVQGAVADLMHGCLPDAEATARLLRRPQVAERLAPFVARDFLALAERRERLPRVSPLATRFSVLAMPSLDVPQRALLVGVDDSRELAAQAIPALLAGDDEAEAAFLHHCEGAGDSLAFMLASRALTRVGRPLSRRWSEVSMVLQRGVRR